MHGSVRALSMFCAGFSALGRVNVFSKCDGTVLISSEDVKYMHGEYICLVNILYNVGSPNRTGVDEAHLTVLADHTKSSSMNLRIFCHRSMAVQMFLMSVIVLERFQKNVLIVYVC